MITYTTNTAKNLTTFVRQFTFPGGEVGVDINAIGTMYPEKVTLIWIDARLANSDDVMALLLTTDALRRHYVNAKLGLFLPYVPYARQDRVCNEGEALSMTVFAKLINSQNYETVQVVDPHSAVAVATIDHVTVMDQYEVFGGIKPSFQDTYIVAPDQGATKKCEDFAKRVGAAGVVTCMKHRELSTGKITGMEIMGKYDLYKRNLLVLDDICDGGRTFIELAAILREQQPAKLELAVTHGIFSKGFEIVGQHYDHVYTTDSFPTNLKEQAWEGLSIIEIE